MTTYPKATSGSKFYIPANTFKISKLKVNNLLVILSTIKINKKITLMFIHSTALSKYLPCLIRLYSKVKFRLAFSLSSAAKHNMANHLILSKVEYPDVMTSANNSLLWLCKIWACKNLPL